MLQLDPPLSPRNGHTVEVIGVCRISTEHQDTASLADQEALYRRWLKENAGNPVNLTVIAGRGSGESLERREYEQLIEAVECGRVDLVLTEDLGRICRRVHSHIFCENAADYETRVIAINDHVDTAREGWEINSQFATMRHESYNRDTAKRIRRSLRNRFSQGGVVQSFPFGYVKPHPHASDVECQKDPAAEAVYREWFERLEQGQTFSEIADWLNAIGVPTGPKCRDEAWDCRMVGRVTRNPILKGQRRRNDRVSRRLNKTGTRRSVKADASELLTRECPHLAFIDRERYDRVIARLRQRNAMYRRAKAGNTDPRLGVSKKRTRWPGQHLRCGVCGRLFVYGGHGQTDHLMCDGARAYKCWNGISADGPLTAAKVAEAVRREIEWLPAFNAVLCDQVRAEAAALRSGDDRRLADLTAAQGKLVRQRDNLTAAIAEAGHSSALLEQLKKIENDLQACAEEHDDLRQRQAATEIVLPDVDELKELARTTFQERTLDSQEFARLMRELLPSIYVVPFRPIDGGRSVLRAIVELNLTPLCPDHNSSAPKLGTLQRTIVVDLFDPPERIRQLASAVELVEVRGLTAKAAAGELSMTSTAVGNGLRLHRLMQQRGIRDPYVRVTEPQEAGPKQQRHRHARYRFEPLPEFAPLAFPE